MVIKVLVGNIDHSGFCGRDQHPDDSDTGQIGQLIGVSLEEYEGDFYPFYTVRFESGREVELVEHEIKDLHLQHGELLWPTEAERVAAKSENGQ